MAAGEESTPAPGRGVPPKTKVKVIGVAKNTRGALIDATGELSVSAPKACLVVVILVAGRAVAAARCARAETTLAMRRCYVQFELEPRKFFERTGEFDFGVCQLATPRATRPLITALQHLREGESIEGGCPVLTHQVEIV